MSGYNTKRQGKEDMTSQVSKRLFASTAQRHSAGPKKENKITFKEIEAMRGKGGCFQ